MREDGGRVVIVGGGTGGIVLANRLADDLRTEIDAGEVDVLLVTDDPNHVYKPAFLYVAFGRTTLAEARRPVRELLDPRVRLRIGRVEGVDTDRKRATLADDSIGYDHLVLAMGTRLVPEETPGLVEGGHHFYGPAGAQRLRDALAAFTEGRLVLSVIGVPHMCPAAPLEFVLMADDWFRERGLREDIAITYTYPIGRVHGIRSVAEWVTPLFDERDIELETFFNPERIDPARQVIETIEGDELEYDLLVGIPPHAGSDVVTAAGLGDDGWAAVDSHTLETGVETVSAIGDVADVPTSKAGSVAHYQAGVVADRIASRVRGQQPTARYDGKTVCFIESGLDEATFVGFGYDGEPVVRAPSRFVHWSKLAYNEAYWLTAKGLL